MLTNQACQRPGRHAADRAVPVVRGGRGAAREGRRAGGPDPRRRLHHLSRHGGRLGDGAQGRRRDPAPVGCSGEDSGPAMGTLTVTEAVSVETLVAWLSSFRDAVHEHGAYLTELDSAIGDADHGANLIRGMDAVMAAVDTTGTPADLLKKVGMTLVTSVGGASGPSVWHVLPAGRLQLRVTRRRSTGRRSWGCCGQGSRASWRGAKPRPGTRRCTTPWRRRWLPSRRLWVPEVTRRGRPCGSRRCGRRSRRDRADAGPQGAGRLSRRAQRRAHRPWRGFVRVAAAVLGRRAGRLAGRVRRTR